VMAASDFLDTPDCLSPLCRSFVAEPLGDPRWSERQIIVHYGKHLRELKKQIDTNYLPCVHSSEVSGT